MTNNAGSAARLPNAACHEAASRPATAHDCAGQPACTHGPHAGPLRLLAAHVQALCLPRCTARCRNLIAALLVPTCAPQAAHARDLCVLLRAAQQRQAAHRRAGARHWGLPLQAGLHREPHRARSVCVHTSNTHLSPPTPHLETLPLACVLCNARTRLNPKQSTKQFCPVQRTSWMRHARSCWPGSLPAASTSVARRCAGPRGPCRLCTPGHARAACAHQGTVGQHGILSPPSAALSPKLPPLDSSAPWLLPYFPALPSGSYPFCPPSHDSSPAAPPSPRRCPPSSSGAWPLRVLTVGWRLCRCPRRSSCSIQCWTRCSSSG